MPSTTSASRLPTFDRLVVAFDDAPDLDDADDLDAAVDRVPDAGLSEVRVLAARDGRAEGVDEPAFSVAPDFGLAAVADLALFADAAETSADLPAALPDPRLVDFAPTADGFDRLFDDVAGALPGSLSPADLPLAIHPPRPDTAWPAPP